MSGTRCCAGCSNCLASRKTFPASLTASASGLTSMAPIMVELQAQRVFYNFIFTSQHKETINDIIGNFQIKQPDYAFVALQQLARNAIMHRTYENTNSPVKIYWFLDRVEIHNPGGLDGRVNNENFGRGPTDYRNPLIAEAMRVMGYVQRFGVGVPIARRELEKNGNPPPEFYFEPDDVLAVIRSRR